MSRIFAGVFLWGMMASAADADAGASLDDLLGADLAELMDMEVYVATRSPAKLAEVPGSVTLISYDQIRASSASTIPELLRSVPGVSVRWNPMVQVMDIRGFGSTPFTNKVLLMIDGVPYNSWNKGGFPQHPGFDFFNIDNIKQIEVIRGAGSALYGENAFDGVINIVTLTGKEYQQAEVSATYGDRDTRSVSARFGTAIGEQGSLFFGGRVIESELPTDLWMNDARSGSEGYDLFLKANYKGLQFSYYRLDDEYGGYHEELDSPLVPPGSYVESARKIEQTVDIVALKGSFESEDRRWQSETNLSFSKRYGSHCASCHSPNEMPLDGDGMQSHHLDSPSDHGRQWFANAQASYTGFARQALLVGAEFRDISAGEHDEEFDPSLPKFIAGYDKSALFAQDRIDVTDRMQLTLGLRYESATDPGLYQSEWFPRIAAVYRASDAVTLRASWNRAARYPSFTERYEASGFLTITTPDGTIPAARFTPNAALDPERIESFEAGLHFRISPRLQFTTNAFSNVISDPVQIDYPMIQFVNHPSDGKMRGLESELKYRSGSGLDAYLNWSWHDGEAASDALDSWGQPLEITYQPDHRVNTGLTFRASPAWDLVFDAKWTDDYMAPAFWYTIAFPEQPQARPLDDYWLADLRVNFHAGLGRGVKGRPLTISWIAKNLFDETPYETLVGSGGRRAGREFFLRLEYQWSL